MAAESPSSLVEDLANAPGTLPAPQVEERFRAHEHQFRHDNTIEPLAPGPGVSVAVWATAGMGVQLDRARIYFTTDGSRPSAASHSVPMVVARVDWDIRTGYLSRWKGETPALPAGTTVRYRIGGCRAGVHHRPDAEPDLWAHDGQGFWFRDQGDTGISTFAYRVEEPRRPLPGWMDTTTIYHVFLDRFDPGTIDGTYAGNQGARDIHGGTITGVRRRLPHIAGLGIGCIWLSPLHPAESYHRYDTMDFFAVDPRLGTIDDVKNLVRDAHDLGIRILLDFVPSHLSWHHPAFVDAQRDPDSATSSWFTFYEWPHTYRSFLNMSRYLPSINTDDPAARQHLIDSAVYWVRDIGIDGFRLDHAIGPSMDFWVALRMALEEVRPDVVMIGEATDTPDLLRRFRGKMHAILDFELAASLRLALGRRGWSVGQLENFVSSYERFMADGPGRVSFLDNHDMDRFLWVADNDVRRLELAAMCQFSLPPTPAVYYGTEVGMSQRMGAHEHGSDGDAEARRDMVWDPADWNRDLLTLYTSLIEARRLNPILATGARRVIALDDAANVWGYVRCADPVNASPGDIATVFNLGDETRRVQLPTPWDRLQARTLTTAGEVYIQGDSLTLGPQSAGLFVLK